MVQFKAIKYNRDNYGFLVSKGGYGIIIDPGSSPEFLKELDSLELKYILLTHHHWDHTDGLKDITQKYPDAEVLDYRSKIKSILGIEMSIIKTPGHTTDSCCFYFPEESIVFTGDTLFTSCCGKVGTSYRSMHRSLMKLRALPNKTNIYPGHEYLKLCIPFIDHLKLKSDFYKERLKMDYPSLGVTIGQEIDNNPFLGSEYNKFKDLRVRKNNF